MTPTPDDDVALRYAPPPRPLRGRRLVAAGAALAVLLALFSWWAVAATRRDLHWDVLTYDVVDEDRVDVTFRVTGDAGEDVRCVVIARAADTADAGRAEADLGPLPDGGTAVATVSVRTIAAPTTVEVRTCVTVAAPLS